MSVIKYIKCDFCGKESDGIGMYKFRGYHVIGFGRLSGSLIEDFRVLHICPDCRIELALKRKNQLMQNMARKYKEE